MPERPLCCVTNIFLHIILKLFVCEENKENIKIEQYNKNKIKEGKFQEKNEEKHKTRKVEAK
jgi:hypothetical protein